MTELQRDTLAYGVVAAASAYLLIWIIPAYTPEYPGVRRPRFPAPRHCCRVHAGAVPARAGAGRPLVAEGRKNPAGTGKQLSGGGTWPASCSRARC